MHVASDGQTALHMAAGLGRIDAINTLIELGASKWLRGRVL
jgi:ankyrin repeat protein